VPTFFILKDIVPLNFGKSYKRSTIKKTCIFWRALHILIFLLEENEMERNQKSRHLKVTQVFIKKASAQMDVPPWRNGSD
jgi:hypothetical protein